jgi:hypothetical protein
MPIGLINGTMYSGGLVPSFEPRRVERALSALASLDTTTDSETLEELGPPSFPIGCDVEGDVAGILNGCEVVLILIPHITPAPGAGPRRFIVSHIPESLKLREVVNALRAQRSSVRGVADETIGLERRVAFDIRPDVDLVTTLDKLRVTERLRVRVSARVGGALPVLMRTWVANCGSSRVLAGLDALRRGLADRSSPGGVVRRQLK